MHTHDRTMLASMGFADKDKKNPKHDLACLYLTRPEVMQAMSQWVRWPVSGKRPRECKVRMTPNLEHHLQKGEGKYATTVGFLDVVYHAQWSWVHDVTQHRTKDKWGYDKWVEGDPYPSTSEATGYLFAEVKIEPIGYGEILRQLNLYRDYFKSSVVPGVLVTAWQLSDLEKSAIEKAGYVCMNLGDGFATWAEAQPAAPSKPSSGL